MFVSALLGVLLALLITLLLAWKWELEVRRVAVGVAALGVLSSVVVALLRRSLPIGPPLFASIVWVLTLSLACAVLAYRF